MARRFVAAMFLALLCGWGHPDARPQTLVGFWEHDPCVVTQGAAGKATSSRATFAFFDREWGLSFTQYSDGECHDKILTATFHGTYDLTGPSEGLPDVTEATFRFAYKGMILYDPAVIRQVNESGRCGTGAWIQGRERDIGATGCLWVESIAACPQEYDLVQVKDKALFLGERPAQGRNICDPSRRPPRLRTVPLIKK